MANKAATASRIKTHYGPPVRTPAFLEGKSMTKQSMSDECDINKIMARFKKTGLVEHAREVSGAYGDFSGVTSYHEALNNINAAHEAFMRLPATIRRRFKDDPAQFVEFFDNPDNEAEAAKLGLIPSKPSSEDNRREKVPTKQPHEVATPDDAPTE